MANYPSTGRNDRWTVPEIGDPSNTLIDGLGGIDLLSFDRLQMNQFTITRDNASGIVQIDSVSGASSTFHLRLKDVEQLSFDSGRTVVNLLTFFGDTTAPKIIDYSPFNASGDVSVNTDITLSFDEEITSAGGSINLLDSNGVIVETFLPSTFAINGTQLSLTPNSSLQFNQRYSLSIASGAVADTSGNNFQQGGNYEFTTVANSAPITAAHQFTLQEDTTLNTMLPLATDADSQALSYTIETGPVHGSIILNADGSFSYVPAAEYSGEDSFSYSASDGLLSSAATQITLSITPVLDRISGTSTADNLTGNRDGDILIGGAGDDILDGGTGLDFSEYSGERANFLVEHSNGRLLVTDNAGNEGSDTLTNIERLSFSDQGVAFDLDGNAGFAAELLGLFLGVEGVTNKEYVGTVLSMLDNGMSYEQLTTVAFDAVLGPNPSHEAVVSLVYTSLVGGDPDAATVALYAGLLDDGSFTLGQFGVIAAEHQLNQDNIGLIGLAETGLEYLLI